jgi:bla regulator protein BlaR1
MEPGVVGAWRPVLLVPEGLLDQLTAAQVDAVIAHQRCHARHRDNLTAAVHMAVEAMSWFHPLVWWIERRLIDERERACDEDVLRSGCQPCDYAEGILAVCEISVRARVACVAGVTGSDLRRRIESILRGGVSRPMSAGRRCALALTVVSVVSLPIVVGAVNAVPLITVGQDTATPVTFEVASVKAN